MDDPRKTLVLELVGFVCCAVGVGLSVPPLWHAGSRAALLGVVAGSFGAGAALTSALKDHALRRRRERDLGAPEPPPAASP